MRKLARDAGTVAGAAVVTAACVIAVARPRAAVADGKAEARAVEWPMLKANGVVLTLATDKAAYAAGERPRLTLMAANTLERPASVKVLIRMLAASPASMWAREMPLPEETWRRECSLDLAPGETRELGIATDAPLAAGTTVMFNLTVGKQALTAVRLAVPGAGAGADLSVLPLPDERYLLRHLAAAKKAKAQPGEPPPAKESR